MDRRKIWFFAVALSCLCAAYFWVGRLRGQSPKYIFINQSMDHRFDQSVRVSIMAASNRTGVQNAVVITDAVEAVDLESRAAQLFSELRVGQAQKGRGILFLFSPAKKLLKIEVGFALEGVLPDATVNGLELAAKTFIYSDRYHDFWAELINTINIEIYEREHQSGNFATEKFDFTQYRFLSGGAGIASRQYSPTVKQLMTEFRQVDSIEKYPAGDDVNDAVAVYLKSLRDGAGEPKLPILSTESRIFRELTPLTTFQLYRNGQMYARAGIDRIFVEADLAFTFFKANDPVLPIVLKREDGKWRVQEPLSWSLFHRFEDSMRVFLKFPMRDASRELAAYLAKNMGQPIYPLQSGISLTSLRSNQLRDTDPRTLYFQLFWLNKVAELIPAQGLADLDLDTLWIAADTFLNLGRMTDFVNAYSLAAQKLPENKTVQINAKFYQDTLQFKDSEWLLNLDGR